MINYINALLADISYLDYQKIDNTYVLQDKEKNTYSDRGLSISEARFVTDNFKVIDHQANTINGFSATTFEIITNDIPGYKKGDIIVAYRGTEGDKPAQVLPDLLITDVLNIGAGINNFSELFTTAVNKIISYVFADKSISLTQADFANKYMEKTIAEHPDLKIGVAGHSLGGYLANYVTLNYCSHIERALTYNAPGTYMFDNLISWIKDYMSANHIEGSNEIVTASDKIINYFSNAGRYKVFFDQSILGLEIKDSFLNGYAVSWDNTFNGYLGLRSPVYAETQGTITDHLIKPSRQALMVYDILNIFQTKNVYSDDGYGRITQILQDYKYPFIESQYLDNDGNIYQLNMSQHLLNIAKMLGVTTNGGEGFDYGISLMQFAYANKDKFLLLDTKNLTEISRANTYNNRAAMYAILNNMPFYFSSSSSIVDSLLNEDKYNPLNYSKEFISSKIDFLKKIVSFRDLSQNSVYNQVNETTQTIYTFFERNNSSDSNKYAYIDVEKKIVYLNNMTREEYFDKSNEEERIYFLNKNDLDNKTLYIKNNNSKVFDSLGDDNIMVLGHNTDIFLTKGKDQITVYVEDASLGHVEILDDGLDDKFTLFGGNQDNNISGTKYTDEIHGMNGNDTLNGFEGNDALFGELGNDTLNGGDGNDILYGNTRDRKTGDLADTGTNILNGGYGADTIYGGEGTDIINYVDMKDGSYLGRKDNESTTGRYGDTIEGRGGDDIIYGTFYGDTYQYTLGDGNDTIIERRIGADTESNMVDRIKLYDIDSLSVSFSHKNTTNLYLSIPDGKGGQSVITFVDFMKNTYVEQFDFIVNGKSVTIDYKTILEKALDRTAELGIPLVGNDFMSIDLDHTETLRGLKDSNNTIIGGYGRDIIIGGDKDDIINESSVFSNSYTGAPSSDRSGISYGDQITGGKGNDTIYGTIYSDTFYYNKGDGKDTITDNSSSLNSIVLGKGIERSNLRVTRDNNYSLILKFTFADGSQNGQIILSGNMGYNNYQILFNDTTKMTYEQMIQEAIKYIDNDNSNTVLGTWYDDVIEGNGGDDIITGDRGNDTLRGGAGNDTLIGGMGLDVLEGGDGDDYINIYRDKTTIDNDSYYNGYIERGDIIRGGRGNDTIYGTYYGDTYYYDLGDGIDTMYELNNGDHSQYSAYRDTLIFGTGIVASEIKLSRDGYNSILEMVDGGKIIIKDFFKMNLIEYFKFADNTVWNWEYIRDNTPLVGTDDADTLIGFDNSIPDKIYGLAGDDKIYGNAGPNFLYGGDGNDTINEASKVDTGGNGASYIEGNKGDDTLYGSTWNTTFKFYIGDGKDTIIDSKVAFNNNMHIISFGEGITLDNISFARVSGSDLRIFYSSDDYITIKNYYYENNNPAYRRGPSYLQFSDGIYFDMYKNQDKVNTLVSTNGDDTFYTLFEKEIVRGQGGNDLFIYNMDNFFLEKAESEYYGEDGDDYFNLKRAAVIDGGEGNDQIYAWSANLVDGGAGDDLISLTESSWRVIGGKGNDTFNLREGQYGTNTYNLYFNVGDGRDIINNNGISRFNFYFNTASGDDFTDAKIIGSLYNNAVNIEYGKNSSILINNANLGHLSGKSTFHFTDRSLTIDDLYNNIYGTDEVDNYDIRNFINSAQIRAGGGNDYILGGYTRTIAYGETGDDTMILRGGYNYFDGGAGNDTYSWVDGYGQINDFSGMNKLNISTYGGYDANYKDMRLTRSGNDLLVQKIYDKRITGGILTIKEQFNGGGVSYINNLSNVNIDKMIELMAQYDSTNDSTEQANYSNEMSKLWYNQTS